MNSNKEAMDLSEIKMISPMLDGFVVGNLISDHHGVRCYPAMRQGSDTRYILKIISIPASQIQTDALLLTGAYGTVEEVTNYFSRLTDDVKNELNILDRLAKMEGFFTYEECQIVKNEMTAGFDIYLLGIYKRSLERHFRKNPMTHIAAVNLGLDICASLTVCRQAGYLYANLKPGNIFFTEDNEYRIGDLGFLPIVNLKYASLPDRYRSSYTPPELADPFAPISTSIDIYAAGLILYQAYNGGVLPFSGDAPTEPLQPPLYADYEMSEIILKACSPNPADRWEDPIKMGQALVGYMQRNGANDTPIIPPVAEINDEAVAHTAVDNVNSGEESIAQESIPVQIEELPIAQDEEVEQIMLEQMIVTKVDAAEEPCEVTSYGEEASIEDDSESVASLTFLDALSADETTPQEEMAEHIEYDELSDDISDILEQADELIAHELPAPPVAPESVEVTLPEPEETPAFTMEESLPENLDAEEESTPTEQDHIEETVAAITEALTAEDDIPAVEESPVDLSEEASQEDDETDPFSLEEEQKPKKSALNKILAFLIALIIIACLAVAAFFFYQNYYIKKIDKLQVSGEGTQLTVSVSTKAEHQLLTVVCTDTYGNRISAPVKDGFASFDDLTPDMLYTITVEVDGFHGVSGDIRTTHTTAPQTEIVSFTAVNGIETGSAILNFTIKGHDFDKWKVTYETQDESEQSIVFSGHMVTVTGLTVGKNYTFTLDAASSAYVVGQYQLQYSPVETIKPENLDVTVFDENGITVTWDTPKGHDVNQWTVMCYNDSGYNSNQTTDGNSVQFTDIDPTAAYNIEVYAAGMSDPGRLYISKNAVTITDFKTIPSNGGLTVSWDYSGTEPSSPWILTYTTGEGSPETSATVDGKTGFIPAVAPGATYKLKLAIQDQTTVIGSLHTITLAQPLPFTGYGVSTNIMNWQMCLAPSGDDWNWRDVKSYQNNFKVGEKAGFVCRLSDRYGVSDDPINVTYVIKDTSGAVLSVNNTTQSWTSLWFQYYGEFTVPVLPQESGRYSIEVYFNGASVHQQEFTISE